MAINTRIFLLLLIPTAGALAALAVFYGFLLQTANNQVYARLMTREHMLVQELRLDAHRLVVDKTGSPGALRQRLAQFDRNLRVLSAGGNEEGRFIDPLTATLADGLRRIQTLWAPQRNALRNISAAGREGRAGPAYQLIEDNTDRLTDAVEALTLALEARRDRLRARMQHALELIAGVDVLLLVFGFYIARHYVSERRLVKRAAQDSETRLQTVVANAPVIIFAIDREGRYTLCEGRGLSGLSLSPGALVGRSVFEKYGHNPELLAAFRRALAGETFSAVLEERGRTFDIWFSPVRETDGAPNGVIGVATDITQRLEAETAGRRSENLFRQLADNVREVFFVRELTPNSKTYVNPAYEEIWGRKCEDLMQDPMDFLKAVHPEDYQRVRDAMTDQDKGQYFNEEYRIVRPDGTVRLIWARSFPILDENGEVYRLAGIAEDITDRRRAEEARMDQVRRQRDALIREVHHRIKNNLQGVVGLLRQSIDEFPAAREPIETAIAQVGSVAVVHGLQGKTARERIQLCDLVTAIAKAAEGLTRTPVEPQVEVGVPKPVQINPSEAVPVALIVNELIFNAVKHAPTGSPPTVRASVTGNSAAAEVTVFNTGTQLPPDLDFARGTGLGTGLTLLRSLLPAKGARLALENTQDGVCARLMLGPPVTVEEE